MALGTITVTKKASSGGGNGPVNHDLIAFAADSSYPTGGTAAFMAAVRAKLGRGDVQLLAVIAQDCGGYAPVYDYANDKLKCYYNDNNNASDGPAIEVPNTTNLSGVTFNVLVLSE